MPVGAASANATLGTNGAPVPQLDWETEALRDYQCATAQVPPSYRHPHGEAIELASAALARMQSRGP